MSELGSSFGPGVPGEVQVQALIGRAQQLVDMPRPATGHAPDWYVEALHVGDVTAIAIAALRTSDPDPGPLRR